MTGRTQDEIVAQCEARMAELEREAEAWKVLEQFGCASCEHMTKRRYMWVVTEMACQHPLVVGFGKPLIVPFDEHRVPRLCGPEKALWEQRPSLLKRLLRRIVSA